MPLSAFLHPGTVVRASLGIACVEGRSNACLGHQNFNTCRGDPRRQEGDKNIEEAKNQINFFFFPQETGTEQLRDGVSSPCQKF